MADPVQLKLWCTIGFKLFVFSRLWSVNVERRRGEWAMETTRRTIPVTRHRTLTLPDTRLHYPHNCPLRKFACLHLSEMYFADTVLNALCVYMTWLIGCANCTSPMKPSVYLPMQFLFLFLVIRACLPHKLCATSIFAICWSFSLHYRSFISEIK